MTDVDGYNGADRVLASDEERGICPVCDEKRQEDGPTDDQIYNRAGVEGGIAYAMDDEPGSLGENDWRL